MGLADKNQTRASLKPFDLATAALSVGGLGFLRPAPGTWGSVPPVLLAGALSAAGVSVSSLVMITVVILLLGSAACVIWGDYGERRFGRKDAAEVVADETAGVCLPVLAALTAAPDQQLWAFVGAFLAFRLFDIFKPWPAQRLEKVRGGWGVLLDDLVAGGYAAALVAIGLRLVAE